MCRGGSMLVAMQLVFTQGRCSPLSRVFRIGYLFRKFNFAGYVWLPPGCYGCHPALHGIAKPYST